MVSKNTTRQLKKNLPILLLILLIACSCFFFLTRLPSPSKLSLRLIGPDVKDAINTTCEVDKLNFPFRTMVVQDIPHYKMFLYGALKDVYISDKIFDSNGKTEWERFVQDQMEKQLMGRVPDETMILDIGANIGRHALNLASKGFIVHAFGQSLNISDF